MHLSHAGFMLQYRDLYGHVWALDALILAWNDRLSVPVILFVTEGKGLRENTTAYGKRVPECFRLQQCFSTAGPRPGTGPLHQLYRAARGSPGICHWMILQIFGDQNGICQWKSTQINLMMLAWGNYNMPICCKISLVQWLITILNVILYLSTCHTVYISVLILFMIMP